MFSSTAFSWADPRLHSENRNNRSFLICSLLSRERPKGRRISVHQENAESGGSCGGWGGVCAGLGAIESNHEVTRPQFSAARPARDNQPRGIDQIFTNPKVHPNSLLLL